MNTKQLEKFITSIFSCQQKSKKSFKRFLLRKKQSYKDERIGQGRENAKVFLIQNEKIREEMEGSIKEKLGFTSKKGKNKKTKKKKDITEE